MNKNRPSIFDTDQCISMDILLRYLDEELSLKEQHRVEKHLLECSLCQEALEGYALLKDSTRAHFIVANLNVKINGVHNDAFNYRKIAASIAAILILGAGLFYLGNTIPSLKDSVAVKKEAPEEQKPIAIEQKAEGKKKEEPIALDKMHHSPPQSESQKFTSPKVQSDEKVISENIENKTYQWAVPAPSSEKELNEPMKGEVGRADKDDLLMDNASTEKATEVTPSSNLSQLEEVQQDVAGRERVSKERAKKKSEEESKAPPVSYYYNADESKKAKVKSVAKAADESSSLEDMAMERFNNKKYAEATVAFEEVLKKEPSNAKAIYYNGLTYYERSMYDKAIENFSKINNGEAYFEDARWHKAMALLKMGEKDASKKLLQEIASGNGPYKQKAVDELKKSE